GLALFFEAITELLAEFGDLWRDHELAVALLGVQRKIITVVVFGRPECGGFAQLRHDRCVIDALCLDFGYDCLRLFALRVVLPETRGFILGTAVIALTTRGGRIVGGKEYPQQVGIRQLGRIVFDAGDFDVASVFIAYLLVAGMVDMATAITREHAEDA